MLQSLILLHFAVLCSYISLQCGKYKVSLIHNTSTTKEEIALFCLDTSKQLSFFDQVSELNQLSYEKPVKFLQLLKEHFDITVFIPESFSSSYYSSLGSNREYKLSSVLAALILMHLFHIPTSSLLCIFIAFSTDIRSFCQWDGKIPDDSFFSRFKTSYEKEIASLFDAMVPYVIDICAQMDEALPKDSPDKDKSSMLIYDTSGLKPKVKENNPKTLVSEINKQKSYAKIIGNKDFNPYAAAYKNMPKHAQCNPNIKLDFVNGHFGYFYKFGMLTNGFGIPLHIHFFDDDFYSTIKTDFETPEDQKYAFDNASLKPVLAPFLNSLTAHNFSHFLGDSEFDSYDNFGFLKHCGFEKVFIPLNLRNTRNPQLDVNDDGTPLCPIDKTEFLPDGSCKGKGRSFRLKYICPKSKRVKRNLVCLCETPCRPTKSTVTSYKYPHKDFRLYPGIQRCSEEWTSTYKVRTVIERELASLKKDPSIEAPRTTNTATMRADLYLSAISEIVTVILAHAINQPKYLRSIRKIIKAA